MCSFFFFDVRWCDCMVNFSFFFISGVIFFVFRVVRVVFMRLFCEELICKLVFMFFIFLVNVLVGCDNKFLFNIMCC